MCHDFWIIRDDVEIENHKSGLERMSSPIKNSSHDYLMMINAVMEFFSSTYTESQTQFPYSESVTEQL